MNVAQEQQTNHGSVTEAGWLSLQDADHDPRYVLFVPQGGIAPAYSAMNVADEDAETKRKSARHACYYHASPLPY